MHCKAVLHCWPCIWCWVRWRVLAIERSWAVDTGGAVLVGCMHPVMAHGGRVWFSWVLVVVWGCCVVRTSLLPLLGGCGILLGSCCHSWTAGIMSAGRLHVTLHGGDVVAKQMWVVIGRCVEVVGGVIDMVVVGWRRHITRMWLWHHLQHTHEINKLVGSCLAIFQPSAIGNLSSKHNCESLACLWHAKW